MDIVHELGSATAARIRERMTDPSSYSAVRSVLLRGELGALRLEDGSLRIGPRSNLECPAQAGSRQTPFGLR